MAVTNVSVKELDDILDRSIGLFLNAKGLTFKEEEHDHEGMDAHGNEVHQTNF
jgi:hypothetical protein